MPPAAAVQRMERHLRTLLADRDIVGVDAGSRGGIVPHWRRFGSCIRTHGFEPDEEACRVANGRDPAHVQHHPFALAQKDGARRLYVTTVPSGSSFYEPNMAFFKEFHGTPHIEVEKVVDVPTRRLDRLAGELGFRPDVVKMDVQGAELDILRGASGLMDKLLCIETEVEFQELYKGQPLFSDVDAYLTGKGLELFDIRTHRVYKAKAGQRAYYLRRHLKAGEAHHRASARLVAGDALYFRRTELLPDPATPEGLAAHRAHLGLMAVYGYYDIALSRVESLHEQGHLEDAEARRMERAVRRMAGRARPVEHSSIVGRGLRYVQYLLKRETKQVFWVKRRYPDQ